MLWQDLRQYLHKLESLGDLRRVDGANWEEDIGGITELMTERGGLPSSKVCFTPKSGTS